MPITQTVIEDPVLNKPFEEPRLHFKFDDDGITNEIVEERRLSSYFVPIAKAKKSSKQLKIAFEEFEKDRVEINVLVSRIRERVGRWRSGGYVGVTPVTKQLLDYWTNPEREKKLFFCQIEAIETAIYISEVAKKYGDGWIEKELEKANLSSNPGLPRIAFKMATGAGKTVVMGMLIAWQSLNKFANPHDSRFSDTFILIAPGITIRDRLRVLLPHDESNYYQERDLIPFELIASIGKAKIVILNFHGFLPRETMEASKVAKSILNVGTDTHRLQESPAQMVKRVCRELGTKKNVVVINDEAHHCYKRKPDSDFEKLSVDEKREADENNKHARVWIGGIESIKNKLGVKAIYDLSATPFFLNGSGWPEGSLFPWVVSDFSLIDAIESGIVKVPRVPVADNSMQGEQPTYRDLWIRIRDHLPKKSRRKEEVNPEPQIPAELEGALQSLYDNYKTSYRKFEEDQGAVLGGRTPPVFIVVCNNTNVSKLVYDYIAGWEKTLPNGKTVLVPGKLEIFSNVSDGRWTGRPNTILVDSVQLESGEAMSPEFRRMAEHEISEFKQEYTRRYPGRQESDVTDEEILREVMNTVGKSGRLGEHIKCVVSVSMLTEGWDANTVTHILGLRAFSTQLICEQVVGRGLRRVSYAVNESGKFDTEYAEVYGVPFSFIPCSSVPNDPKPGPVPTRVRALKSRVVREISFPRVVGYRYDLGTERLKVNFEKTSPYVLSTENIPTLTENAPIIGESSFLSLDGWKLKRENEVAFEIGKVVLERYFRDDNGFDRPWFFPQVLKITKQWMKEYVVCKDNAFKQLLLMHTHKQNAAALIYQAIAGATYDEPVLKPILRPYDAFGSTEVVNFDTIKPVFITREDKCHVSHVVADTGSWEQKVAEALESMVEVNAYVKNQNLGFSIPYVFDGIEKQYIPDFIVRYEDGSEGKEMLNLVLEVTGERFKAKAAKVSAARNLWVPAVNNHGGLGRWDFIEILDPWNAQKEIRDYVKHGLKTLLTEGGN
jgi:type III restriction enzyme